MIASFFSAVLSTCLLVEAESFADRGGWTVDQQFMSVMGSPYMLAHGAGVPVADAVTRISCPQGGVRRLWVRTRDWVAPQAPGRFQVKIGSFVSKELGVGDGAWHWEDCGPVTLASGENEVRLHDLTGFEGRVDALLFTDEAGSPPAVTDVAWRRKALGLPEVAPVEGDYDFVVVGGGIAGMCAAVAAAREGLKVALVHDRPVFGGNGSVESTVYPDGKYGDETFPRNADLLRELHALIPNDGKDPPWKYVPDQKAFDDWVRRETNITVYAPMRAIAAERTGDRIATVTAKDIRMAREVAVRGRLFADCTGNASFAEAAGVETRWDMEPFEETHEPLAAPRGERRRGGALGSTNPWRARKTGRPCAFPACPWALRVDSFAEALEKRERQPILRGGWNWESGYYRDPEKDGEAIRDHNLRAIYGFWDFAKNRSPEKELYADAEFEWVSFILAKRDAHRIPGDYIVTANDMIEHTVYPDGVVDTTWYLDFHFPNPRQSAKYPGGEWRSTDFHRLPEYGVTNCIGGLHQIKCYPIPYRCFYSKDIRNLFMAGKNISGTYTALSSYRVQNTTGQMGTMVGRAAAVCIRHNWDPRELGRDHFDVLADTLRRKIGN